MVEMYQGWQAGRKILAIHFLGFPCCHATVSAVMCYNCSIHHTIKPMTNIELLECRVVECIIEFLQDMTFEDDDHSIDRSKFRLDIAILWQEHQNDISRLFYEIYLLSLVCKISTIEFSIERLDDFPQVESALNNGFIAPVLLLAAKMLNWLNIAGQCQENLFHPALMGQFETIESAVEQSRAAYNLSIQREAEGGGWYDATEDYSDE